MLLACAGLSGCDSAWPDDQIPPLATEILEIRIEPNPVPAGTEVTLTAIIKESTKAGFKYSWNLPGGVVHTTEPRHVWKAPAKPGEYLGGFRVSLKDRTDATVGIVIIVTENP